MDAIMPGDLSELRTSDLAHTLRFICPRCRSPIDVIKSSDLTRCPTCGFDVRRTSGILCFVDSTTAATEWQDFYDAKATAPDGNTATGVAYTFSFQHRYIVDAFRKVLCDIPDFALVLDVGCGNGLFWQALFGNRPVIGVDYSLGMCILAHARGMRVYQADAMGLPFADNQFDVVYSAEAVQLIDDLPAVFRELTRICRPGGLIVVSTLSNSSLVNRAIRLVRVLFPRRNVPRSRAIVLRSPNQIFAAANMLELKSVRWTHFPLPWQYNSKLGRYLLAPFASNMIFKFRKPSQ